MSMLEHWDIDIVYNARNRDLQTVPAVLRLTKLYRLKLKITISKCYMKKRGERFILENLLIERQAEAERQKERDRKF